MARPMRRPRGSSQEDMNRAREKFPVGAPVDYHGIIGGPVTKAGCKVTSEPWEMGGTLVVMIDGVRGAVAVDALSLAVGEVA